MKFQLLALTLLIGLLAQAQNPVQWSFSSKKIADKTYEVHFKATVQHPWHVYSQATPDGGPIPTSFSFSKNPMITLKGPPKEVGKMLTKYEEVFGVDVKYFDGSVAFVQVIKLKANVKTNITGALEYMACNDEQCLPPASIPFSIALQ